MGLFSNMRKQNSVDTSVARSMLVMPLLAAAADGKIDPNELTEIGTLCSQNPIFLKIGAKATTDLLAALVGDLKKRGGQTLFNEAVANMPPKLRETALCFAVRVAAADGHIDEKELEALKTLGMSMGIPPERFVQIVEVLLMLHRSDAA